MDKFKQFINKHRLEIGLGAVAVFATVVAYKAVSGQKMIYGGVSFGEIIDAEGFTEGYGSTITMHKANGSTVKFDKAMTAEDIKDLAKELTALTKPLKPAAAA